MSTPLHSTPNEPKRLGMDELSFFVQMVKFLLNDADPARRDRFWLTLHRYSPNLSRAILGEGESGQWSEITFTRSIRSAAFMVDDSSPW